MFRDYSKEELKYGIYKENFIKELLQRILSLCNLNLIYINKEYYTNDLPHDKAFKTIVSRVLP